MHPEASFLLLLPLRSLTLQHICCLQMDEDHREPKTELAGLHTKTQQEEPSSFAFKTPAASLPAAGQHQLQADGEGPAGLQEEREFNELLDSGVLRFQPGVCIFLSAV